MIYILLLLIIVIILILLLFKCCSSSRGTEPPPSDNTSTSEPEKTLDFVPAGDDKVDSITIPAVSGINLKSGQLQQKVDFYNPEENQCYFIISIYLSDDTLIYQSDYTAPGEKITEIDLLQTLQRGTYKNCYIVYNCYTLDSKATLNSGKVKIEINSY